MKQNFQKKPNKVVNNKIPLLVMSPFVLPILLALPLASNRTILYGNVALLILVFSI